MCVECELRFIFCIHTGASNQEDEVKPTIQEYSAEELKKEIENKKKKYERALKEGGVALCWKLFEEEKYEWKYQKLNIAIVGRSGIGKSSFVNAIMKKWTGECPAKVGLTETTMVCTGYAHHNNPNIILWDLPGVGTEKFPQASYLEKVNADLFDVFIIMTEGRFTEHDTWLGKVMQKRNIPVIFVRTKIHIDVKNSKHDHPEKDARTALDEVKADMIAKSSFVKGLGVFLIDSHKSDRYEFSDLEKCITEKLGETKGQALVFSVSRMSKDVVEQKVAELRKLVWSAGTNSYVFGALSMMFREVAVVESYALFFVKQLGLDVQSLEQRAIDPEKLNSVKRDVEKVIADIPSIIKCPVLLRICQALPLIGGSISADIVNNSLKEVLNRLETIALEAINVFTDAADYCN